MPDIWTASTQEARFPMAGNGWAFLLPYRQLRGSAVDDDPRYCCNTLIRFWVTVIAVSHMPIRLRHRSFLDNQQRGKCALCFSLAATLLGCLCPCSLFPMPMRSPAQLIAGARSPSQRLLARMTMEDQQRSSAADWVSAWKVLFYWRAMAVAGRPRDGCAGRSTGGNARRG